MAQSGLALGGVSHPQVDLAWGRGRVAVGLGWSGGSGGWLGAGWTLIAAAGAAALKGLKGARNGRGWSG